MGIPPTLTAVQERSRGRGYFWAGIGLCLLGLVLVAVQFSLKLLMAPWYCAVLATLGAGLLFYAVTQRRSIPRFIALLLVTALAGFEWYFLISLSRLPPYQGPAREGEKIPAFHTTLADGRSFTEKDLHDGRRSVLVFFRGRW